MKKKFTIPEQIEHMETKGILFNIMSKKEAAEYLVNNNYYFRLKAYAKNYDKCASGSKKGEYLRLEFAYLKELAILDMILRNIILNFTKDIEHHIKRQLINDIANESSEDGYTINIDAFELDYIKNKFNCIDRGYGYCQDLVEKYRGQWAIWNVVEVLSMGDTITLYNYFYTKYPKYKSVTKYLYPVRLLRNAAAHNNCMINTLKKSYSSEVSLNLPVFSRLCTTDLVRPKDEVATSLNSGKYIITSSRLKKKMENALIGDVIVMLHAYAHIVTSETLKRKRFSELSDFINVRAIEHKDYFENNEPIKTTYQFFKQFLDFFISKCI